MRKMRIRATLTAIALAFGLAAAPPVFAGMGDAGTFYLTPEAGVYGTAQKSVNVIATLGASAGYFVAPGFSIGLEALGYYINQRDARDYVPLGGGGYHGDVGGFGSNFLVRYYPVHDDAFALYIGTGIGVLFAGDRVPTWENGSRGYYTNATLPVDLGVTFGLTESMSLELAARYQRIGFQNPGVDAFGGRAGLRFTF